MLQTRLRRRSNTMHLRLKSAVDQFRFMSGEGRASVLISKAGELLKLQKMRTNTVLAMLYVEG